MTRVSTRTIGAALATVLMTAGFAAMAQTSPSGATNMNNQGAPVAAPPANSGAPMAPHQSATGATNMNNQGAPVAGKPAHRGSSTSSGASGSTHSTTVGGHTGTVETGNAARGGSGTGTGQTPMPGDRTSGNQGSGAGGK